MNSDGSSIYQHWGQRIISMQGARYSEPGAVAFITKN